MLRHTDQLYRLAELPAFIEEALSNVSLKGVIQAYVAPRFGSGVSAAIQKATEEYAEQWVETWISFHPEPLYDTTNHDDDVEIRAIEAGVKLFSNPDCKVGLPE